MLLQCRSVQRLNPLQHVCGKHTYSSFWKKEIEEFADGDLDLNFKNPFKSFLPEEEEEEEELPVEEIDSITPAIPVTQEPIVEEEEEVVLPELVVSGLIWNTDRPQAIINDTVVSSGDLIEQAEVVNITKVGVAVLYKSEIFIITIKPVEDTQETNIERFTREIND